MREVTFEPARITVTVALRRRRLVCADCSYSTPARYDTRTVDSRWRHLDLGCWRLVVKARLRRLACPEHGVRTEQVPFARSESGFTRDVEDLVAWLATRMDKTAVTRLTQIAWQTVGAICQRVVADELDAGRLDELFEIGVDEVSWRKGHRYLTLVTDHRTGRVVWGAKGKDTATLDQFFAELGADRSAQLAAVSTDMGPAYLKSVAGKAPNAIVCLDPFHVVKLATDALDTVRRQVWNELRRVDPARAKKFKGARWVLLKRPERLSDEQAATLRKLPRHGGAAWRAYGLKEGLRAVFTGDLAASEAAELLDRWCVKASRSRLEPLVKLAGTIRTHRDGILAAIRLDINNARVEALNNKVRLLTRRAYGFHSAEAALALVVLACGPITLRLPHEQTSVHPYSA
ncbi:MAG: ISL3 family transposase [Actinomycetes bacterium]